MLDLRVFAGGALADMSRGRGVQALLGLKPLDDLRNSQGGSFTDVGSECFVSLATEVITRERWKNGLDGYVLGAALLDACNLVESDGRRRSRIHGRRGGGGFGGSRRRGGVGRRTEVGDRSAGPGVYAVSVKMGFSCEIAVARVEFARSLEEAEIAGRGLLAQVPAASTSGLDSSIAAVIPHRAIVETWQISCKIP